MSWRWRVVLVALPSIAQAFYMRMPPRLALARPRHSPATRESVPEPLMSVATKTRVAVTETPAKEEDDHISWAKQV